MKQRRKVLSPSLVSVYTLHNKDDGEAGGARRKRALGQSGRARSGVQMCRRFCKVTGRMERASKRKSLWINGPLNFQENEAAEGDTRGRRRIRGRAVIRS